jgi:ferrous iron transport protein A
MSRLSGLDGLIADAVNSSGMKVMTQMTQTDDRPDGALIPLGTGSKGFRGTIVEVGRLSHADATDPDAFAEELERRLLEIGFVEGASVEILHEGFLGRDPIAIRVDDMSVALRRREANAVWVRADAASPAPR